MARLAPRLSRSIVTLGLLGLLIAPQAGAKGANLVAVTGSPTLREVKPARRFEHKSPPSRLWRARAKAGAEFAAMTRELAGERTMVFIGRDGLLWYWVSDLLSADEPKPPQMKVVSYSLYAGNGSHPQLPAYLADQGLARGKTPVGSTAFIDGALGNGGTLQYFRDQVDPAAMGHVVASLQPGVPSLRTALRHLDQRAPFMSGPEQIESLSWPLLEQGSIPYDTGSVQDFQRWGPRIEALAAPSSAETKAEVLRYKEHLRFLLEGELRPLYERRRVLWRQARKLAERGTLADYVAFALATQQSARSPERGEALVRDLTHLGLAHFPRLAAELARTLGGAEQPKLLQALQQPQPFGPTLEALWGRLGTAAQQPPVQ